MFSSAVSKASRFIRPVVVSQRHYDGSVDTGGGALVIVNRDGWFLSAAHLFEVVPAFERHKAEIAASRNNGNTTDPRWITNYSIWTGIDNQQVKEVRVIPDNDLLLGRLYPFDPSGIEYPVFKDPASGLGIGTSLCKLGYPFQELASSFDAASNQFKLNLINLVLFPMDGIFTRDVAITVAGNNNRPATTRFIETSTPGLRGQSGGPIFGVDGLVWGIQSRTHNLYLGYNPRVRREGKEVEENQFLNVGLGAHPEVLVRFMKENGVAFEEKG
ncbi:MAG: trypsin-like peptidase domain-containing protein [Deltaproteobacteria bacterium]|nr:trypsin-like peptidase domain-containing protein [Deltaproteobacteria bacterium]